MNKNRYRILDVFWAALGGLFIGNGIAHVQYAGTTVIWMGVAVLIVAVMPRELEQK